jgi:RimJ/RimL family protein N-acetyltransferase
MKKPVISTPRLTLHAISPADENALMDLLAHPTVGQTYMLPEFTTREEARPLAQKIAALSMDDTRFVYGVFLSDRLIGMVNDVTTQDTHIELGYAYHPNYYNRGYATEVLLACIEALLSQGYPAVRTGAFPENTASIRVMEKAGMTRLAETETVEYRGKAFHCVLYERAHKNIPENTTFCL